MSTDEFSPDVEPEDLAEVVEFKGRGRFPVAGFYQRDVTWHEDALCAEVDAEMFFPEKGGSTKEAKGICGDCLVRAECLEYALDVGERFGIWGMTSERERRRLLATLGGAGVDAA